jgi:restriction endonuclease S subunit
MTKLKELVVIRSGYTFRTAIDSFPNGDVEIIQAKDLGPDFSFASRPKINFSGDNGHLLQPGEVLFSSRGISRAVVYRDSDAKAVASSSLFVLCPKNSNIDASFIAMYLSSTEGIKQVMKLSAGAVVKTITKDDLGSIEIPELPPDKQRALGGAVQAIDDYLSELEKKTIYLNNLRSTIIQKTLKGATK